MGFNWRTAFTGLLAEGGRQTGMHAERLGRLEEKKLQDQIDSRREESQLTKAKSLQVFGYTEEGRPVTRGEYEEIPEGDKPILYAKGLDREKPKEEKGPQSAIGKKYQDLVGILGKEKALEVVEDELKKEGKKISTADKKWLHVQKHGTPEQKMEAAGGGKPTKEDKPEMSKGKVLKEIATVTKTIETIDAGKAISGDAYKELLASSPVIAALIDPGKELSGPAKERVIKKFTDYLNHLEGIVEESKGETIPAPSGLLTDKPVDYGTQDKLKSSHKRPLSSF